MNVLNDTKLYTLLLYGNKLPPHLELVLTQFNIKYSIENTYNHIKITLEQTKNYNLNTTILDKATLEYIFKNGKLRDFIYSTIRNSIFALIRFSIDKEVEQWKLK